MSFAPQLPVRLWQIALPLVGMGIGVFAGVDPIRAALLAGALAVAVIVLNSTVVGICLFTFLAFLDYSYPNVAALFVLLLAMSWLAVATIGGHRRREFLFTHPAATWLVALLPAWAGMTLLWAAASPPATSAVVKYGVNGALFLIVFSAVRTRRHVLLVLAAFIASAVYSAVHGLVVPGEALAYDDDVGRIGGPMGDPNALARLLVAGVVVACTLAAVRELAFPKRLAAGAGAALCAVVLVLTYSRGGLIGLGCALAAALVFAGRWRAQVALLTVALTLVAGGSYLALASPEARDRLTSADGGSGRTDLWRVGWRMVEDNPVLGVGAGNYGEASREYIGEAGLLRRGDLIVDVSNVPHNTYLGTWIELGLVGLLLLLGVLAFCLGCLVKAARTSMRARDVGMELLARGLFVALVGMLAADFFISEPYNKHLWLLLAVCPAVLAVARDRSTDEAEARASSGVLREPRPVSAMS